MTRRITRGTRINRNIIRVVSFFLALLSLVASTYASHEYLLPAKGSHGRSVRYFADHELNVRDANAEYAVVMVHGVNGGNGDCTGGARRIMRNHVPDGNVFFIAPCFLVAEKLSESDQERIVYWGHWQSGQDSPVARNLSPYDVLDTIFGFLNDNRLYPKLKHVLFCGYSAGGQVISRYMAVARIKARKGLSFSFAAGAPSSWLFLNDKEDWHYGLNTRNRRYVSQLSKSRILKNIKSRHIVCVCGTADTGSKNLSMNPRAVRQGANRYERFKNFRNHISTFKELKNSFEFFEVEGVGHDSGGCWRGIDFARLVLGKANNSVNDKQKSDKKMVTAGDKQL